MATKFCPFCIESDGLATYCVDGIPHYSTAGISQGDEKLVASSAAGDAEQRIRDAADWWRKCPLCGKDLIYHHRVTVNSWVYTCEDCENVYYITEEKTEVKKIETNRRMIIYNKFRDKIGEFENQPDEKAIALLRKE